ncbi:MAG: DedA family protein [Mucilaginibacter polytrichastri]|nr:DedA family protein [Mucilaginibacter polytrichastri]
MEKIWEHLHNLTDAQAIIAKGGIYFILFVIFAETGLFFGFFLPGDYLLFLAGVFCATGKLDISIYTMLITMIIAAISGNFVGYWFGRRTGPVLYKRKDSFFFKARHLRAAENYYHKQGAFALIMGRFVPIVRTFAPIVAGIIQLNFKKFALYNVIGAVLWITTLTLLGFFLGKRFEKEIEDYLLYIIIGFIAVTAIPLLVAYFRKQFTEKERDETNVPNN